MSLETSKKKLWLPPSKPWKTLGRWQVLHGFVPLGSSQLSQTRRPTRSVRSFQYIRPVLSSLTIPCLQLRFFEKSMTSINSLKRQLSIQAQIEQCKSCRRQPKIFETISLRVSNFKPCWLEILGMNSSKRLGKTPPQPSVSIPPT